MLCQSRVLIVFFFFNIFRWTSQMKMEKLKRSLSFRKKKDPVPECSKPHQWLEDERKVREGTCSFQVRVSALFFCFLLYCCHHWILYGVGPKSSFTLLLSNLSKISSSFAIFLLFLSDFLFTLFLMASMTRLV